MSFASGRADACADLPGLGAIHEVSEEEKENRAHKKATQKVMSNKREKGREKILEASDHGSSHAFARRRRLASA